MNLMLDDAEIVVLALDPDGGVREVIRADEIGNDDITVSAFELTTGERLFRVSTEHGVPRPRRVRGVSLKKLSLKEAAKVVLRKEEEKYGRRVGNT